MFTDGELAREDFSLELAELLRSSGPWGQAFPEPLFDGRFQVLERRVVGERHLKLFLKPQTGGQTLGAIAFNAAPEGAAPELGTIQAAYRLDVNEYQGSRSVQLVIEHLEPV
jgi:single-stranded-DNA-specific exonuclease